MILLLAGLLCQDPPAHSWVEVKPKLEQPTAAEEKGR